MKKLKLPRLIGVVWILEVLLPIYYIIFFIMATTVNEAFVFIALLLLMLCSLTLFVIKIIYGLKLLRGELK